MREGIHWRGGNGGRRRRQECNPNQSFFLRSGRQSLGRAANIFIMCLILWFVTWTLLGFRTPSLISTEYLPHKTPTRAVLLDLFRYDRHPQARNRIFTGLAPVHQRRRGLLEVSGASTQKQIFVEEQAFDGQGYGGNLTVEFNSTRKRKVSNSDHESMACSQGASSSTCGALGQLPLFGGGRESDQKIESFFVKVALGYGTNMKEYFMDIDTGSGTTWVNCKGRGPMVVGPNGLFHPKSDSFLNCKDSPKLCDNFQGARLTEKYPCDRSHKFRCSFEYRYGDDTAVKGSVIMGDASFQLSDGSRLQTNLAFGCADKRVEDVVEDVDWMDDDIVEDDDTVEDDGTIEDDDTDYDRDNDPDDEPEDDTGQETTSTDGLLGLGPHRAGWLRQLNFLGILSEYVIAVCLEPEIGHLSPGADSSVLEHVGFISLGDSMYTRQAASTTWTATVPSETSELEAIYFTKLVGIKYREAVHVLQEPESRRIGAFAAVGVRMGFDIGSVLTYLTQETLDLVVKILDLDASRMGYISFPDRGPLSERRKCWQHESGRKSSPVRDFGDLIMMFSSLVDDGTTSDLVIKPDYYITSRGQYNVQRLCFNIRLESEFDNGLLGAEAMRGHLLIFDEQQNRIGWSPVTSCKRSCIGSQI